MDFKEFPTSKNGYNMIVVFVDRLGKRPISIPCHKTVTAKDMARMFIMYVYRTYGPPDSIVSDRGPQFISNFWDEFCKILGIKIKLSTANHPQTDGQTEIVNQYIDQRLRPYVNYYQDNWDEMLPMMDFAQATLSHETTGQSPFMTELGYQPRTSFDWKDPQQSYLAKERLSREEAAAYAKSLQKAQQKAQENTDIAKERYTRQANKHRREIDFEEGDHVWVSTKDWNTTRPSRKLSEQTAGPFKILERKGNAFHLELPASIKVNPVLNAEKLRKAADDPLPGQINPEPPPIEVNGEHEWEVEKILGVRTVRGKLRYKVKWLGFDDDLNEYPAADFRHAPQALKDFHDANPSKPGPPVNLDYWLQCALSDDSPLERKNDNTPA